MATFRLDGRPSGWDVDMGENSNRFSARVDSLSEEDFDELSRAVAARKCREKVGVGTFDEAVSAYRPRPKCPRCGFEKAAKDGRTRAGHQRYRCPECGARFSSLTNTVFENCKKDFPTWVRFVELMTWNVPVEAAAEVCGITHQTAWEWRHRVFATVDGYQDGIVLEGRVWIDEAYIADADLAKGPGEARRRGLSRQQLCIAVAIDERKNPVAVVCGHGKPSTARIKDGLLPHIKQGSHIVHDKEKAHNGLVRAAKCTDEAYKADVRDPAYLECMAMVNNLCSWLKRYLRRFVGMDPKNLQSYLNWFVYLFRVNQSKERWPKMERVVRHLLMSDASYRTSNGFRNTTLLDC